jgi:hypothetical protein
MVYPNIYEQPAFTPRIKSDTSLSRHANQYTVTFSLDLTKFLEQLCISEVNKKKNTQTEITYKRQETS